MMRCMLHLPWGRWFARPKKRNSMHKPPMYVRVTTPEPPQLPPYRPMSLIDPMMLCPPQGPLPPVPDMAPAQRFKGLSLKEALQIV